MQGPRTSRVGEVIREALMDGLTRGEIRDPRISQAGLVTITRVEVSADLRHARVYFVLHEGDAAAVQEGLEAARGFLRHRVGKSLRAKAVPELRFFADESFEKGRKVEELLAEIAREEKP